MKRYILHVNEGSCIGSHNEYVIPFECDDIECIMMAIELSEDEYGNVTLPYWIDDRSVRKDDYVIYTLDTWFKGFRKVLITKDLA